MSPSWRRLWVGGRRLPFDPWKAVVVALLVGAVVVVVGWVLLSSRLLVVRQIQVAGEHRVAGAELVEAAQVRLGTPLIHVEPGAVERRVEGIRQVESARVERRWPSTLRITVAERTPVAAARDGSGYQLVDRFGVVVTSARRRPSGMPLVDIDNLSATDPSTRAALAVVDALPGAVLRKVSVVSAPSPTEVNLRLKDGRHVEWGSPERSAEKARTLAILMKRDAQVYDVSSPEVATTQ
ncbi:MAG: FtsQ-type POTRA domain-containing protein [Streptosporangiales bacterium]|nr:FtsQ-type POTRA domain-containing protein [Streptosporangiales bacterium]